MTRNPVLNALSALGYITLIALVMFFGPHERDIEPTILMPILMMSIFTLSAAVMGFIFLSQPIQLYLDGKKKEAVNLFIQTVGVFGIIPILIFILIFSGIFG